MVRVKVTLNGVGNGEMVALRIDPASDTMENVLSKAKAKYDPGNLFANTDNIKPHVAPQPSVGSRGGYRV